MVEVEIYIGGGARYSTERQIMYTVFFPDGKDYSFKSSPDVIIKIDSLFPDTPKRVIGAEYLDKLCKDQNCSEETRQQLEKVLMIEK